MHTVAGLPRLASVDDMLARMIVVSRFNENVSWVPETATAWGDGGALYAIYNKEQPDGAYNVPVNKGAEGSAYLRFVIDHYDRLPEWTFFVHGNETAWHHDGTLGERLAAAWGLVMATQRTYVEINNFHQSAGLDKARGPLLSADEPNATRRVTPARLQEWRQEYLEPHVDFRKAAADWVRGSACCAQFLVHRGQIAQYPREFYQRLYDWTVDPARDDYVEPRFLEYAWHVIWGDDEARHPDPSLRWCGRMQTAPGHTLTRPCTAFERAQQDYELMLEDEL